MGRISFSNFSHPTSILHQNDVDSVSAQARRDPGPTEKSEFYDTGTKSVSSWLTVQS